MSKDWRNWRGYFAASPTPFAENGALDLEALKVTLAWLIDAKPHGMVINGTTGEWFAQTIKERQRVLEAARAIVPATMPLLVGISSILPDESILLGEHARVAGADGVLLTIPPARRLTEDDILGFYKTAAARISLPIMIYNVPGFVGYDLPPALICRLQAIEGVVGVKDNTASVANRIETLRTLGEEAAVFSDVLEPTSFSVFAEDGFGRGQIGSGMPLGRSLSEAFEFVWGGRVEAARSIVDKFTQFKSEVLSVLGPGQPWHAQIKALMYATGVDAGFPRHPTTSLRGDAERLKKLGNIVRAYI